MSKIERPIIKATLVDDMRLVDLERKEKALEIINRTNADIYAIKHSKKLKDYNSNDWKDENLTQEEFDLLKEELK